MLDSLGFSKKIFFVILVSVPALFFLSSCHIGYITNNGYEQMRLLNARVPLEKVLADPKIAETTKHKLILASEAKRFAEERLALKKTKNYNSYVELDRPYVTYALSAAPKDELSYYTWRFPLVGKVPYKGYFELKKAQKEEKKMQDEGYDTYVRGVSAYSTLGWFHDPLLSSMMRYSDYDLVNTIIHETVHATLFIADNANFNERLATYLGDLGTQLFYEEKFPDQKNVLKKAAEETEDQRLFAEFISEEIKRLEGWYKEHKKDPDLLKVREEQFSSLLKNFETKLKPKLKTDKYVRFSEIELNNAKLMAYKLYMNDLSDFEKLTQIFQQDFSKILDYCRSLEKSKDPEKTLKEFVNVKN